MRDFEFSDGWLIVALGIMTMSVQETWRIDGPPSPPSSRA